MTQNVDQKGVCFWGQTGYHLDTGVNITAPKIALKTRRSSQEVNEMGVKKERERERVLVPVRRHEAIPQKELPEEPQEPEKLEVPKIPRRWYLY